MLTTQPVLIGTPESIAALAEQIYVACPSVRPIGCVTIERGATRSIGALRVLGALPDLGNVHAAIGFSAAVVSLPRSCGAIIARVRTRLRECGIVERFVPPLEEMLSSPPARAVASAGPGPMGEINLAELIGRVPYGLDRRAVSRILEGRRVVITGAGGSIGSELARLAAAFRPELLVLMERSENALFEIDRQIGARFPGVPRKALLHDVTDAEGTRRHALRLRPHVVFHAAAHKHVPLMEDHPAHAVANNLFGTKAILDASIEAGAERFVLISSDKAVNPTSVMGATKRLAEVYTQAMHARTRVNGGPRCAVVRFGNVLGSACSVLPIWQTQLAEGGPITVTDERMTRYFMTIHEAATLVMQSAAMDLDDARAAVFVLDMGEPVRILDLAERFVRLHGFDVGRAPSKVKRATAVGERAVDALALIHHDPGMLDANESGSSIEIRLTGARPGEKLHEELAYAAEHLIPTPHPGIRAWAEAEAGVADVASMIADLEAVRASDDRDRVLRAIQRHVPHMQPTVSSDSDRSMFGIGLAA